MATLTEQLEMAEQLLFKKSVNEAIDVLNKIGKKLLVTIISIF